MRSKKRRQERGDADERQDSASDIDTTTQKASRSKSTTGGSKASKTAKKPKFDDPGEDSPPDDGEDGQLSIKVLKDAEGQKYVNLGRKRRATVRSFKGQIYVDIREFYDADGAERPGKKGISLSTEQWETLKRSVSTIDSFLAEGKK